MSARPSSLSPRCLLLLAACALAPLSLAGCPGAPRGAEHDELLWPDGAPGARGAIEHDRPRLFFYPPAKTGPNGHISDTAVIVASGGSYGHHGGLKAEGEPTARWLAARGITAVVLRYRVGEFGGYDHEAFFADGVRAIQTVRARADELGVAPDKIGVFGFSAGGHMAASLATRCADGSPRYAPGAAPPDDPALADVSCRPDFAIAVYPVVTLDPPHAHMRSRYNLLGGDPDPDPALVELLSVERQVTPQTAPMVLVHSRHDKKVPYQNSELLHAALAQQGVDSELMLFDDGAHGLGLADHHGAPAMATWPGRALEWMRARGFYSPPAR